MKLHCVLFRVLFVLLVADYLRRNAGKVKANGDNAATISEIGDGGMGMKGGGGGGERMGRIDVEEKLGRRRGGI